MTRGKALLISMGLFALLGASAQAQNLLIDGDFSVDPGSGTPSGTITAQTGGAFSYDATTGTTTVNGGLTTNVGGTGGWSFQNGEALAGAPKDNSAINLVKSSTSPDDWVAPAAASNINGYVVQLDSVSHSTDANSWNTGNAIYQTVTVTAGQSYAITFSINTEATAVKAGISAGDVMVTNATITNSTGSSGTVLTSSTTNKNALSYGNVTGYQYQVDTSASPTGATALTWATYTLDFTATSNSVQIAFADDPLSANSNISLEDLSLTAVPEPRVCGLMMLLGTIGLIAMRKLRSGERQMTALAIG